MHAAFLTLVPCFLYGISCYKLRTFHATGAALVTDAVRCLTNIRCVRVGVGVTDRSRRDFLLAPLRTPELFSFFGRCHRTSTLLVLLVLFMLMVRAHALHAAHVASSFWARWCTPLHHVVEACLLALVPLVRVDRE